MFQILLIENQGLGSSDKSLLFLTWSKENRPRLKWQVGKENAAKSSMKR